LECLTQPLAALQCVPPGAIPTLAVGMRNDDNHRNMPTANVGVAPVAIHLPLITNEFTMPFEVEQKFPVANLQDLERRLLELGATISPPHTEADLYFAHPARDFRQTDEALRIRRKGEKNYVTYKGPKIDATTKTRREIELPVLSGEEMASNWRALLEALGFRPVAEVRKSRRKAKILWQSREVEGSLDDVEGVGSYFELELIAEPEGIDAAKFCIGSLATHLGLQESERRSYLELLLNKGTDAYIK
jgi:adenylate cyclase, class 2